MDTQRRFFPTAQPRKKLANGFLLLLVQRRSRGSPSPTRSSTAAVTSPFSRPERKRKTFCQEFEQEIGRCRPREFVPLVTFTGSSIALPWEINLNDVH